MITNQRDAIIEACAGIADDEPIPGEPCPEMLARIEQARIVVAVNAACVATKRSIARRIRALKGH